MGVHIAIDDFGTGYSSLTYLHRLPVDTVKLDRSFVAGVADDLQKRAIVTAVVNLTKALGHQSIAEGVETERELAELRILGCTAGQGHLLYRALPPDRIAELLAGDTHLRGR
jgi:EAL domain-containing protein (putative c-di-GMP-specific phosphodiesterase class I)